MKSWEKHDLLAAILAAKTKQDDNLRLQWRTFAANVMAVRLKTVIDATMCAIIA